MATSLREASATLGTTDKSANEKTRQEPHQRLSNLLLEFERALEGGSTENNVATLIPQIAVAINECSAVGPFSFRFPHNFHLAQHATYNIQPILDALQKAEITALSCSSVMGDGLLSTFGKMLEESKVLSELNLTRNIRIERLQPLVDGLRNNTSLTSLSLRFIETDLFGENIKVHFKSFAAMLGDNRTLQTLTLSGIGAAGIEMVAKAIASNPNSVLRTLNFPSNGDTSFAADEALENLVRVNRSLRRIGLTGPLCEGIVFEDLPHVTRIKKAFLERGRDNQELEICGLISGGIPLNARTANTCGYAAALFAYRDSNRSSTSEATAPAASTAVENTPVPAASTPVVISAPAPAASAPAVTTSSTTTRTDNGGRAITFGLDARLASSSRVTTTEAHSSSSRSSCVLL